MAEIQQPGPGEQSDQPSLPTGPVGSRGEQAFMQGARDTLNEMRGAGQPADPAERGLAVGDSSLGSLLASQSEYDATWLKQHNFTPEEAKQLLDTSRRVANSAEAQESTKTLRRLKFAQWLIERRVIGEFNVEEGGNTNDSTDVA